MIAEQDLADLTEKLKPAAESLSDTEFGGATEFEFKTALGFAYWQQRQCEWVALEVGLGGRLDATNVVHPKACVIVSVGLDHTTILGDTVEAIASEKAGIIKPGIPVIVGEVPRTALQTIEEVAAEQHSAIWRFGREISIRRSQSGYVVTTPIGSRENLTPGLIGAKQAHNMSLAVAALQAAGAERDCTSLASGTRTASLPGRFERINVQGKPVVLDGAHNPDAAIVLRENLDQFYAGRYVVLLTGMVSGHDPAHFYESLRPLVSEVHLVPIHFHRAIPPAELAPQIKEIFPKLHIHQTLALGIESALTMMPETGVLVVCGSFYLVGEVGAALRQVRTIRNPA